MRGRRRGSATLWEGLWHHHWLCTQRKGTTLRMQVSRSWKGRTASSPVAPRRNCPAHTCTSPGRPREISDLLDVCGSCYDNCRGLTNTGSLPSSCFPCLTQPSTSFFQAQLRGCLLHATFLLPVMPVGMKATPVSFLPEGSRDQFPCMLVAQTLREIPPTDKQPLRLIDKTLTSSEVTGTVISQTWAVDNFSIKSWRRFFVLF